MEIRPFLISSLQMDMERVQAEVQAKVAAEQQNEDVMLRKIRAQVTKTRPQIFVHT